MRQLALCLISLFFLFTQCKNTRETKHNSCDISIEDIKNQVLGKNLNAIHDLGECFTVKDSLFEDDEGQELTWPGKVLIRNNKESIIIETNWVNKKKIHRITILDNKIQTVSGIHTGITFNSLRMLTKLEIERGGQDGYLFVYPKDEPDIYIEFDLSKISPDSKLNFGADNLDEIPSSLIVSSIVIM